MLTHGLYSRPEVLAFLDAREHPEDDTPRLVLADWLDEQGGSARAEFTRPGCVLAPGSPLRPTARAEAVGCCRRPAEAGTADLRDCG